MSTKRAVKNLQKLSFIEAAGAAPSDLGGLAWYQLTLKDISALNEENQEKSRQVIQDSFDVEMTVNLSKGILNEDTSEEKYVFWAVAYSPYTTIQVGGLTYDVVAYGDEGVSAIAENVAYPDNSVDFFKWSEIDWSPP